MNSNQYWNNIVLANAWIKIVGTKCMVMHYKLDQSDLYVALGRENPPHPVSWSSFPCNGSQLHNSDMSELLGELAQHKKMCITMIHLLFHETMHTFTRRLSLACILLILACPMQRPMLTTIWQWIYKLIFMNSHRGLHHLNPFSNRPIWHVPKTRPDHAIEGGAIIKYNF